MRTGSLTLAALVALALPLPAPGQTGAAPVHENWEAAYLEGGRAGYVHTTVEKLGGPDPLYRTTVRLNLRVKRFSSVIELRMDTGTEETADGKVTGVFMRQYLGQAKKLDLAGKVVGKELKLTLDGGTPLAPAPWDDRVVGLYRQQTLFRDRDVKPGDAFDYLSFEPSINLVVRTAVQVKDYEEVELPGGGKRKLLRVESVPGKVQNVQLPGMTSWLSEQLEPVKSVVAVPGLGELTLYRTTKESATALGPVAALTDIGLGQMIPLRQRVPRPYDTATAVYRVTVKGDAEAGSTFSRDARQTARDAKGNTFELVVRAGAAGQAAESEVGAEYRESNYFINCDDPRVRQLARQAVGEETDPWRKALRIERWVRDHMRGRNHEAMATADHVARTLEGDCSEFAMLMAAMCRAEGVPSRTAIGLIYADVERGPVFSFHMWTEVWADGRWVPLDATLGRGRVGATHLKITDHSWHETRSLTPLLPVLRVLGRMSIDVVRAEPG